MMPSLFISHGTPLLATNGNEYTKMLQEYAAAMQKPKAILMISAHYLKNEPAVSAVKEHGILFDFAGFPDELYRMNYPAKGCLELSDHLLTLLSQIGMLANFDESYKMDHGAWVPLELMYPENDVPVVSISINPDLSMRKQYEIGKVLSILREKNILIISSGEIVCNRNQFQFDMNVSEGWAFQFEDWVHEKIMKWDLESLADYEKHGPFAAEAVPEKEHFIPLIIAMGTGHARKSPRLLHRSFQYGNLSLAAWEM